MIMFNNYGIKLLVLILYYDMCMNIVEEYCWLLGILVNEFEENNKEFYFILVLF